MPEVGLVPPEPRRWYSDSAVPLIALATDACKLLIDEFAARHGRYFLLRAPHHERLTLLSLTEQQGAWPVEPPTDTWVYKLQPGERRYLTVGRGEHDIGIADATVEIDHATIDVSSDPPTVVDHGSTYGTWVGYDAAPAHVPTELTFDRDVRFGLVSLVAVTAPVLVRVLRALYPES